MSPHDEVQVEIHIGHPVEHASERTVLERVVHLIGATQQRAIILANVSINGQQIDTVVATGSLVLVIEAKGFNRPVNGSENGPWQVWLASGQWKDFRNPYLQARDTALALRDAMRAFAGTDVPYPAAAVVFVPAIPPGSQICPGDFKVSVSSLDGLGALLKQKRGNMWPVERWQAFAKHLQLTPASSVAAACDRALAESEALLRQYQAAHACTYADPEAVVPFACRVDGEVVSSNDVVRWVADGQANIMIQGPSGCGKTLLAGHAGRAFAERGGVAVTLPIKDHTGSLKTLLDREVGLLIGQPATTVLGAARRRNLPLLFVIDGYNECAPSERPSLTRGLAGLARIYEADLLVTSQTSVARGDLLALRMVEVAPATPETKTAIALNATGGATLPEGLTHLLDTVTTGLEARLIGEVGQEVGIGSSRCALFDLFARKRLTGAATEGIGLLSRIAGWLSERIAFSLSIRDFERLLEEHHAPHALGERLHATGLLTRRGDRISFVHEMFLDAFAAEHVLRRAGGDATEVLRAVAAPRNDSRKALIIGAIDDDILLTSVLVGLTDGASVSACLAGTCGGAAQKWAERQTAALWDRLRTEASGIRFSISDQGWNNVAFEEATLTAWTPSEHAFLAAMPQRVVEGYHLDEVLATIAILDQRIAEETARLRGEARERKVALLSALFASVYVGHSVAKPGITQICIGMHGGFRATNEAVGRTIKRHLTEGSMSPGQLYLLLMLSRGADIAAPLIVAAIRTHWATAPYHLRLDLLDAARMSYQANDEDRSALIAAIEALPQPGNVFISSMIVDALQGLGALENSAHEHIAVVREEVKQCLAAPEDPDHCALAYGLYYAQFDHPYAGAYCEVIAELPVDERKTLFAMAANGADNTAFFLAPLLMELASFYDPGIGDSIARWTALPPKDCIMPQDAIAVFFVAHIALARLGCALPNPRNEVSDAAAQALTACGTILYWCNRADLDETTKRQACDTPLRTLTTDGFSAALNVIRHCEHALIEGVHRLPGEASVERSILDRFPSETTDICRRALRDGDSQIGYFRHYFDSDRMQDLTLAIHILARHGDSADLGLIKGYADDDALGRRAIEAVRTLEAHLASS